MEQWFFKDRQQVFVLSSQLVTCFCVKLILYNLIQILLIKREGQRYGFEPFGVSHVSTEADSLRKCLYACDIILFLQVEPKMLILIYVYISLLHILI